MILKESSPFNRVILLPSVKGVPNILWMLLIDKSGLPSVRAIIHNRPKRIFVSIIGLRVMGNRPSLLEYLWFDRFRFLFSSVIPEVSIGNLGFERQKTISPIEALGDDKIKMTQTPRHPEPVKRVNL